MIEELRRVCELQALYSPDNTPAMQERGHLIRQVLTQSLRNLAPQLAPIMGVFGSEFDVGASDGIGRKTQAPWFRLFARSMSPTPRDGFYGVIHFAADGSAVFVTVGCGSTIWAEGNLTSVSKEELARRREWARNVVHQRFGTLEPFTDEIVLGATAPLTRTFERATAICKRIPVDQLDEGELQLLLVLAAERLAAIYEAQRNGNHLSSAQMAELEVVAISRPSAASAAGQGFGLGEPERRAVEMRAMDLASTWLRGEGYSVTDTSANSPFDFLAKRDGQQLKIEVKGTTSPVVDAVLMTKNEVDLHRKEAGSTGLIIVSGIVLTERGTNPKADGGTLTAELGWDIGAWDLLPLAYKVVRRTS